MVGLVYHLEEKKGKYGGGCSIMALKKKHEPWIAQEPSVGQAYSKRCYGACGIPTQTITSSSHLIKSKLTKIRKHSSREFVQTKMIC